MFAFCWATRGSCAAGCLSAAGACARAFLRGWLRSGAASSAPFSSVEFLHMGVRWLVSILPESPRSFDSMVTALSTRSWHALRRAESTRASWPPSAQREVARGTKAKWTGHDASLFLEGLHACFVW